MFYRSEICQKANGVTKWQHRNKVIKDLEDIRHINEEMIFTEILQRHHVDFLVGTPLCNDFSRANPYGRGLDGKLIKQIHCKLLLSSDILGKFGSLNNHIQIIFEKDSQ